MDLRSLIAKMDELIKLDEESNKKPDKDGDGVPDWADKKDGEDDHDDEEEDEEDKEKVDEAGMIPSGKLGKAMLAYKAGREAKKAEKKAWPQDGFRVGPPIDFQQNVDKMNRMDKVKARLQKEGIDEAIAIQADGDEAMALLDILKLSGQAPMTATEVPSCGCGSDVAPTTMQGSGMQMSVEADEDLSYANTPNEKISPMGDAIPSGDDLHKEKDQYKHNYRGGDNPMAMKEMAAIEGKLAKMFESMSKE